MAETTAQRSELNDGTLPYINGAVRYAALIDGIETYRYDTVDRSRTTLALAPQTMRVFDIRPNKDQLSYTRNGFELRTHRSAFAHLAHSEEIGSEPFLNDLKAKYVDEMTSFIREVSGTPHVFPQPIGFFVRHSVKSSVKTPEKPAALPHIDFTAHTANQMAEMIRAANAPDRHFSSFAVYQTWRTATPPPQDNALIFCDPLSVKPEDFRIVESIMGPEHIPGNVFLMEMALHNPAHSWLYFSNMTPDEVILFQGWDARSPRPVLHTSIDTPGPDASPRVSIETRHYAFFD